MSHQSKIFMLKAISKLLGQSAILMIVLISESPSRAGDSDILLASRIVVFSIAKNTSSDSTNTNCTGTLLNLEWMMTAAHCIDVDTQSITVRCTKNSNESVVLTRPLQTIDKHTNHDIALLQFEESTYCLQPGSFTQNFLQAVTLAPDGRIATSLFTFAMAGSARQPLTLLEANTHTYIADDERCLTQGDSGTPAFSVGNDDRLELAAVLISGTSDCPALQILANVSDFSSWVDATIQWQRLLPE